jgi:hypothetical protein
MNQNLENAPELITERTGYYPADTSVFSLMCILRLVSEGWVFRLPLPLAARA